MNTTDPFLKPRPSSSFWRSWGIVMAIACLPFLLRLSLDVRQTQRLAVHSIYRDWRAHTGDTRLTTRSEIRYRRAGERSVAEDMFLRQIQRDFRVVEVGPVPQVRAYFDASNSHWLRARIEILDPGKARPVHVWNGESRVVNTGLLLGMWLATLGILLGLRFGRAIRWGLALTLLWASGWNPLHVPGYLAGHVESFVTEMYGRWTQGDWIASELGRVPLIGVFVWSVWAAASFAGVSKMIEKGALLFALALSFLAEPLMLMTSHLFGQWGEGASWWKVYVGSFSYRFFSASLFFFLFLKRRRLTDRPASVAIVSPQEEEFRSGVQLWIPLVFVFAGIWDWTHAALAPNMGETLMRLRFFWVAVILSFTMGARLFPLWLAVLVWAIQSPPTTGHWNASAHFALLVEGSLLGWWLSPFHSLRIERVLNRREVLVMGGIAWLGGVLLSSVGVPLGICWLAVFLAVWGYDQVYREVPVYDAGRPVLGEG